MMSARYAAALAFGLWAGLSMAMPGCSLGNVGQDDCNNDDECRGLFGLGSLCSEGYCSDAIQCGSNFDCRDAIGVGAICESGSCAAAPVDERCVRSEPPELIEELPGTLGDRIVFGAMFKLDSVKEDARATAVEQAISEINSANGIQGRKFGVIVCNNDSDGNADNDPEETIELTQYLAGSLGVAAIIGPSSSANVTEAVSTITGGKLDTVLISPSATGIQLTELFDRIDESDAFGLFWRTAPSDAFQGRRLATLLGENSAIQRVAVIFQQDVYGSGVREIFRTEFEALDAAHEVDSFPVTLGDAAAEEANIASAVQAAVIKNPHAVLVVSGDAARTIVVLQQSVGTPLESLPFFLTDGSKDANTLLNSGDVTITAMLQGALGTAAANPQDGNFVEDFNAFAPQKRNKDYDARDFSFVAHSYDATYVAAYGAAFASQSAKTMTGRLLAEGMSRLSDSGLINVGATEWPEAVNRLREDNGSVDIEGASGPLDFDASTGDAPAPIEVWKVNNNFDGFVIQGEPEIP